MLRILERLLGITRLTLTERERALLYRKGRIVDVLGAGRVGMRICPDNPFNDLHDEDPQDTFEHLLASAAAAPISSGIE